MGLIKVTRENVALNCSTWKNGISPIDFSAQVIVELYPSLKKIKKDEDVNDFQRLLTILEKVSANTKKHNYTKKALIGLVKALFLDSLEISDLKDLIKDSGYCQFPPSLSENMSFRSVSQNPPKLRTDYGEEEYIQSNNDKVSKRTKKEAIEKTDNSKAETLKKKTETDGIKAPAVHKSPTSGITENSLAKNLLASLYESTPSCRDDQLHTWEWFLSEEEYKKIKSFIASNTIPTPAKLDSDFAKLIKLYIGEFFKREWDGSNNPFMTLEDSINNNFKNYNLICCKTGTIPYTKINDTHQQTLFVDGGLPIHYINSKLDSNSKNMFIDSLSLLLDDDDILIAEGEYKLGKSTSTALRESYHRGIGHSIYGYINAIRCNKPTWNVSDDNHPDFIDFVEKVKDARIVQENRRKFKMQYSLWTYCENSHFLEFSLTPTIRFKPIENSGQRHFAITPKKLHDWGVKLNSAQFKIHVQNQTLLFSWCYSGDYISQGLKDSIELLPITDSNISDNTLKSPDIRLTCEQEEIYFSLPENAVIQPQKKGIIQFYTNDNPSMALWQSNKGNQPFRWSGIIFDKSKYTLEGSLPFLDINDNYGWITFEDSIKIYDSEKGKSITINNQKESLLATIEKNSLHNIADSPIIHPSCITDNKFKHSENNKSIDVYLVNQKNIKFIVRDSDSEEPIKQDVFDDVYSVLYQVIDNNPDTEKTWVEYKANKELQPGLYKFLIAFRNQSATLYCYTLPKDAKIGTHLGDPHTITFHHIGNVVSLDGLDQKSSKDVTTFKIANTNKKKTFEFAVDGIRIKTYNPEPQVNTYINGIETHDNLLLPYAEDIKISIISSKTCNSYYLSDNDKVYKRLFDSLQKRWENNNDKDVLKYISINEIFPDIDISECRDLNSIRYYTKEISKDTTTDSLCLLKISDNEILHMPSSNILNVAMEMVKKHGDCLLFQSLKNGYQTSYYTTVHLYQKTAERILNTDYQIKQDNLSDYVNNRYWTKDHFYVQFEIACEHKIYFAELDSLLSLIWNSKKKIFNSSSNKTTTNRFYDFLSGYSNYCFKNNSKANISGLKRLAKEFQFDWNNLSSRNSNFVFDNYTLDVYKKLIIK